MHMTKIGRNELCPCGSGKKYKNCCKSALSQPMERHNGTSQSAQAYVAQGKHYETLGMLDEAIRSYHAALSVTPSRAEVHNDLGLLYQAKGQLDAAVGSYRAALAINPELAPAHFNLGRTLQIQGQYEAATESYLRFLAFDPDYFQAHHNLGVAFEALGLWDSAVAGYKRAFELKPAFFPSLFGLVRTLTKLVPLWHVPMMNDTNRNDAYFAALRSAVTSQSRVFEIGAGSGLLSMMAAQLGAEQVTTCEAEPLIAETAKQIVADNGLAQKIRVIAKKSTEVTLKDDLLQPAGILVQEVFSSNLLSEGVLSSIEDAKRRLLTTDCKMIPAAASIMIALFGGEEMESNLFVEDVYGFNLRQFNSIVPRIRTIQRKDLDLALLSEAVEAFKFDFERDSSWQPEEKVLRVQVTQSGRCLGVLQWIRLYFNEGVVFENHPKVKTSATGWPTCAYLNNSPIAVTQNQIVSVFATHDKMQPWFGLQDVD